MDRGAWWAAIHGVTNSRPWLSDFTFTFHFHALEKEMATHSSVLAWRIPGTEEAGGLPSIGLHRVGHDWSDLAAAAAAGRECSVNVSWINEWWIDELSSSERTCVFLNRRAFYMLSLRWQLSTAGSWGISLMISSDSVLIALKLPQPGPQPTSHHSQALPVPMLMLIPITLPENWRRKGKESQIDRVSEGIFLARTSSEAEFQLMRGPPPNVCDQVLSISLSGFCDRPSRSAGRIKGLFLPAPKSSFCQQTISQLHRATFSILTPCSQGSLYTISGWGQGIMVWTLLPSWDTYEGSSQTQKSFSVTWSLCWHCITVQVLSLSNTFSLIGYMDSGV